MQTIFLDCSALHNIRVEKGDFPSSLYVDGSDFLFRYQNLLDQNRYTDEAIYKERLRDEFAAKAMQVIIADKEIKDEMSLDDIAKDAYRYADAMLLEREK